MVFACPTPNPRLDPTVLPVGHPSTVQYDQNDPQFNIPKTDNDTYDAEGYTITDVTISPADDSSSIFGGMHGLFLNHHFSPFGRYNAFVLDADAPFVHATVDERNAKR
jgi:hypothetical protein